MAPHPCASSQFIDLSVPQPSFQEPSEIAQEKLFVMPPRKRAASTTLGEPRRSRRTRTTAKKSNYFEDGDESDDPLSGADPVTPKKKGAPANRRTSKAEDIVSDEYEDDAAEDQGEDDEEEGGAEDDDDDDDFDTKVTVVKVPGLRPDGGMEYADKYVHKNTALFLKDLKQNNNRLWLKCMPPLDSLRGYLLTRVSS